MIKDISHRSTLPNSVIKLHICYCW